MNELCESKKIFKSRNSEIIWYNVKEDQCLKRATTAEGIVYLNNEIQIIEKLSNPATRQLYICYKQDEISPYIIMKKGEHSLRDLLYQKRLYKYTNMGYYEVVRQLINLIRFEDPAFIHGDLKPENIVFYQGEFFLIDFAGNTRYDGESHFTWQYASPELQRTKMTTVSSDLYAMIKILMECAEVYFAEDTRLGAVWGFLNYVLNEKIYLKMTWNDLLSQVLAYQDISTDSNHESIPECYLAEKVVLNYAMTGSSAPVNIL